MTEYVDFEVPVTVMEDGRHFISAETCLKHPEVHDFVLRFPNFYVYSPYRDGWESPLPEVVAA